MKSRLHLQAMTMPELLVVMVLSGIIVLSVMDGLSMTLRMSARIIDRIEQANKLCSDYAAMEALLFDADSVLCEQGGIRVYSARGDATIVSLDTLTVVQSALGSDIIFGTNSRLVWRKATSAAESDTITIRLLSHGRDYIFSFAARQHDNDLRRETIESAEAKYQYDE